MIKREEITDKEFKDYTTRLIPRLRPLPSGKWVRIDVLTDNVPRFIDICQYLANTGYFSDDNGWLILEVYQDSLIRLNPMYQMNRNNNKYVVLCT